MTRRLAVALCTLCLTIAGCGGGDDTPTAAVLRDASPRAAEAAEVLLDGTGIPFDHAPGQAEPTPGAADLTFDLDDATWTDVGAFAEAAGSLADQLTEAFPASSDRIAQNRDPYLQQLAELDAYAQRAAELVPEANRTIESNHAELEAFADAYGYEFALAPSPTELDEDLALGSDEAAGMNYVVLMDQTITAIAEHLGASGIDEHGITGQVEFGHDHGHDHAGHDH